MIEVIQSGETRAVDNKAALYIRKLLSNLDPDEGEEMLVLRLQDISSRIPAPKPQFIVSLPLLVQKRNSDNSKREG